MTTLLEEDNVISLRTAFVFDDEDVVSFKLVPSASQSLTLGSTFHGRKVLASQDYAWLCRHQRSVSEEMKLMDGFACMQQNLRPLLFNKPPIFRLVWTDSGNGVALYLNGEPWAFIDEKTHQGFSKGVFKHLFDDFPWNQELFEKEFKK